MSREILIIITVMIVVLLIGCEDEGRLAEYHKKCKEVTTESAGVVVKGYNIRGSIHNTNEFPVRIKCVIVNDARASETTDWVQVYDPNQCKPENIFTMSGYYISDMNGVEIGWIKPYVRY